MANLASLVRLSIAAAVAASYLPAAAVQPPREPEHEFTFVVLGDSQFHLPNTFNRLIDDIVHLYPAFVIQVGDMISGYVEDLDEFRAQWKRFHAQIAPLREIPFYPVPGNHDVLDSSHKPGGEKIYKEVWGATYYSFDYRNAHFIVLNTDDREGSEIAGEQLEWLKRDLGGTRKQDHIFVFGGIHLTGVRRDPHQCSAADRHGRFAPGRSRLVGCPRRLGGSGGSFLGRRLAMRSWKRIGSWATASSSTR